MARTFCLALLALVCGAQAASAQAWAEKMFSETNYNFGSVARGALVEHQFTVTNVYGETVHLAGVRSSCGCTTPRILKDTLAPGEKTAVVAHFNTDTFSGQRGARLTVTIDKPYYAEVQLQVNGYIRTDVVLYPGQVAFGSLDQGTAADKTVKIDYAGRNDWQITGIKSNVPYLSAEVKETARGGGRVGYELAVHLSPDAPAGYLNEQLVLQTNDRRATTVPVAVEGLIVAELSVSPATLLLGTVQPGQTVTKQIIVRGKKPFSVLAVECDDASFSYEAPSEPKAVHLIPVTFTAPTQSGRLTRKIVIRTDLGGEAVADIKVSGQVAAPLAGK